MNEDEPDEGPPATTDVDDSSDATSDETMPKGELTLYQLSVKVSGQSDDSLDSVEASAKRRMDFLVDHARESERGSDNRGLGYDAEQVLLLANLKIQIRPLETEYNERVHLRRPDRRDGIVQRGGGHRIGAP